MIDINLNGVLPTHVDRIKPKISVDKSGKINWVPGYLDYNASNYFPGKTVRSEEFNKHNLQHVYQGNYITDVLQLIFDKHLPDAVYKLFTSEFNLAPSFVKTFTADDWGEKQEDGYYYITVTAEEHGFPADTAEGVLERMNIDTEMYLLNTDGNFYEVQQISTASDNTVQAYSDDNTLAGFLVIRTNDKAYALAEASIHASQIIGLADSALSGKYADLVDLTRPDGTGPEDKIKANTKGIASILSGIDEDNKVVKVAKALQADNAKEASAMLGTGTLGGRVIDNIFEEGSNTVKKATNVDIVSDVSVAEDTVSFSIGSGKYTKKINNVEKVNGITYKYDERFPFIFLKEPGLFIQTRKTAIESYDEIGNFIKFKIKATRTNYRYLHGELWFEFWYGKTGIGDESKFCECISTFSIGLPNAIYPIACTPTYNLRFKDALNTRYVAPYLMYEKDDSDGYLIFKLYTDKILGDSGIIDISNKEDVSINFAALEVIYSEQF